MCDFDNLDTYNGDSEHDMWVDFDNYENTGTPMFSMNPITTTSLRTLTTGTNSYEVTKLER